jgi:hypothetical protein
MNYRQRKAHSVTAIVGLLFLMSHVSSALAQNYTLNSLYSENQGLPQLPAFAPSINNFGQVAYQRKVFDPVQSRFETVIMIHDGTSESVFFNFTDAFVNGTNHNVVINDNGAVAVLIAGGGNFCPTNVLSCLIRINADRSVTVLATDGAFGGGTTDFAAFESDIISMNNLGQVAVKVVYNNGTRAIVRIDDNGITEITQQTATLTNFTTASINNSGVVAFKALDLSGGCSPGGICVFSGMGGPLTKEGVDPGGGGIGFPPFINNNGLVLAPGVNGPLIYTAQGGVVNPLVVGNEDPVFSSLSGQPSQNDLGQFVFVSAFCCPGDFGMFTGNDPSEDAVFRSNQTIFGGTPRDFRTALHYINNSGQIAFALNVVDGTGTSTSHIVRADPVPQDTTPPDTSITSSPGALTNSTSAIFSFTSTEAGSTFACGLDNSTFTACTNPQSYSSLAPGSHTFQVRATDAANNTDQTPASFTWIIDNIPPDTTITSAPPATTNSTSASFSFTSTEAGSTFECSLDGAPFTACTSSQNYTGLAAGGHNFQVRAIDAARNFDTTPASHTWTINALDTTPPDTTITSNPPATTNSTSASFSFTSTEAGSTFACSLDGATFIACTSSQNYTNLANGSHTFQVRATDPANNTDPTPASYTWTVNTAPSGTAFCSILGNDPKPSVLDQDIYKLRGTKGEQVRIRLEASGSNNTGDKASLALIGIGLLKTDNSALPNVVSAVLPTTGEYLVIVAEQPLILSSSRFRGNYCVSVQSSGNAAQTFQPKEWVE